MSRRLVLSSLGVLALLLTVAGCSRLPTEAGAATAAPDPAILPDGALIDGHQVGSIVDCTDRCEDVLSFAETSAIETRSLDPDGVTVTRVYTTFLQPGMQRTGGGYVVVYDLVDGVQMAIRVHCGVGPCVLVPPQPINLELPIDYSCKDGECIQCQGSVCTPWVPPSLEPEPSQSGIPEPDPSGIPEGSS